ncbi:MAG: hypothetical protein JXA25_17050 [Anaerolineales bacterium]|nr:hypothetical protein [Anaerolineales bacterium]
MSNIWIIVGVSGTVFAAVMTILSAVTFRKPRKISAISSMLSGTIAAATLGLMVLLGGLRLNPLLAFPTLFLGLLLGFLRGQTVRLLWQDNQVVGRNSILFLLLWGFSLVLSQLLGMLGSPLLASLGLIPAAFSTGLQLGFYGNLFLRRLTMRQQKPTGSLHTIIGIGGGLALSLLLLISLVIAAPTLIRTFPGFTVSTVSAASPDNTADANVPGDQQVLPDTSPTPGLLPVSGSIVINCDAALQKELDEEEPYAGIEGQEYSFEEIFESYNAEMEMRMDLSVRRFNYYFHEFMIKRDLLYDPDWDEEPCPLYSDMIFNAEGIIYEDGWIAGDVSLSSLVDNCTGSMPDEGTNQFYGYIDDALSTVVFCPLPVGSWFNLEDYTADFESLRQQGKEQLISNWWSPDMCRTCTVDQVLP